MNKLCMKDQQNVNNEVPFAVREFLFTGLHTASTGFTAREIGASNDRHDGFSLIPS